jgi:TorA maturation chaperone TorD
MENDAMMSEHAKQFLSESQEIPSVSKNAAGVQKSLFLHHQDAEARGNMYLFLSEVYLRPPKRTLVRAIVDKDFLAHLSSLFSPKAVTRLKKFAATAHFENNLASLNQEYMDLFVVPTGRYVTPFEDVYRGGKSTEGEQERGLLMGERAVAVRRMYREAGAQMDRACKELPTHIGVELSFMGFLCEREAVPIRSEKGGAPWDQKKRKARDSIRYREHQIRFLQEHLNAWFPQLCQSIQAKAKSQYYRGLALITEEFLARDTVSFFMQSDSEKHIETRRT